MVKSTSCLQWPGKKYVGTCSQPWRARSNFSAVDPRSEESTVLQQHFKLATLPFAWSRDFKGPQNRTSRPSVSSEFCLKRWTCASVFWLNRLTFTIKRSFPLFLAYSFNANSIRKRLWGKESESSVNHILPKLLSWIMPSLTSVRITLNTTCQIAGSAHWSFHL